MKDVRGIASITETREGGFITFMIETNRDFWKQFITEHKAKLKRYYAEPGHKYPTLELILKPLAERRSTGERSQCNRINGFIRAICEATGNDFDDVKLYCKKIAMGRGYPWKLNSKGDPVYSKIDGEPIPESEANITKEQAKILIEVIEQVAAEENIVLPEYEE